MAPKKKRKGPHSEDNFTHYLNFSVSLWFFFFKIISFIIIINELL